MMEEMNGGAKRGSFPRSKKIFQEKTLRKELADMRKAARHITGGRAFYIEDVASARS